MNNNTIKELKIDEIIWLIFITLNILNIIGDECIIDYYTTNKKEKDKQAKEIFTITILVSLLIYLYFLYQRYITMKKTILQRKNSNICEIRFISTILVVISTIISLYCQIKDRSATNPSILNN